MRRKDLPNTLSNALTEEERWINPDTGEVKTIIKVAREKKRRRKKSKVDYVQIYDTVQKALFDRIITFDEYSILVFCANQIDWNNQYVVDRKTGQRLNILEISKIIRKDERDVSKHLKSLESKGYVKLDRGNKKSYNIIIPEFVSYKGEIHKNKIVTE